MPCEVLTSGGIMRRREFISLVSGAGSWPLAARAQQAERMRRIGVLIGAAGDDSIGQARIAAFQQGLQQLGWTEGGNLQVEYRWSGGDAERIHRHAAELAALAPDVILASSGAVVGPLRRATRTVPIVFTETSDPVGAGFVESLPRPGGNVTGFLSFEYGMVGKWLELLKQIAIPSGTGQWGALQSVAPTFVVELRAIDVHYPREIERAITAFARTSNGGMIVTASALTLRHRDLFITLAARHKLPAVYFLRGFVTGGGLISYGADTIDVHRRAAGYVDRILKGEKPADLPVQAPTRYELVVISRPPRRLASMCRRPCSHSPARSLNEAARVRRAVL